MDRRILTIIRALHNGHTVTLPINFWETLLLLSCRDLGVKFVYGDIEDFEEYLVQLDNLIMFDASGHRLHPLIRGGRYLGGSNDTDVAIVDVPKHLYWKYSDIQIRNKSLQRWQFPKSWIDPVQGGNHGNFSMPLQVALRITSNGPIVYPTLPNHSAFYIYRFDISNIRCDDEADSLFDVEDEVSKRFKQEYNLSENDGFLNGYPVVNYKYKYNLKSTILKCIYDINTKTFTGFDVNGFAVKPTKEQGEFLAPTPNSTTPPPITAATTTSLPNTNNPSPFTKGNSQHSFQAPDCFVDTWGVLLRPK